MSQTPPPTDRLRAIADEPGSSPDRAAFFRDLSVHLLRLADEFESTAPPPGEAQRPVGRDSLQLAAFAEALIKSRQRRSHWISASLLGEPAWDLLLQLYANAMTERRHTVADLAAALKADVPLVNRWVQALMQGGMVSCNTYQDRRTYIELVGPCRAAMGDMLSEWRHLGQLFGRGY